MKTRSLERLEPLPAGSAVPAGARVPAAVDLRRFLNAHAVAMLVATTAALALHTAWPLSVAGAAMFGRLAWRRFAWARRHDGRFGWGNSVTLVRTAVLLSTAAAFAWLEPVAVFALLILNVLLDGVDGIVARRCGECSEFGATFDAEVDALYVMVAGLFFFVSAGWGVWVLVAGALRYVHRLVAWKVAGPDYVERPRRYARTLAGVVFVLFSGAILFPPGPQLLVLVAATATSSLSFSISFIELARHGERPPV